MSDDEFEKQPKPKYASKKERILARYGESAEEFNLKDLGHENEDGMIMEGRKCTDPICCGIFMIFVFAMFLITQYAFVNGNLKKLLAPMDGAARFCGVTPGYEDFRYLYFRNLDSSEPVRIFLTGVCTKECPTVGDPATECMSIHDGDLGVVRHRDYCVPAGGGGQSESYDTKDKFNWCIPPNQALMDKQSKSNFNVAMAALQNSKFGQWTFDIYNTEYSLVLSYFFAYFFSGLFVYAISSFGETLAKVAVGLFQVFLIAGAVISYIMKGVDNADETDPATTTAQASHDETMVWVYWFSFILFSITAVIYACVIFWSRKSIRLAVDVIDASADFVADNRRVFIVPLVFYGITSILFVVFILGVGATLALNNIIPGKIDIDPQDRDIQFESKYVYMLLTLIFGFLWIRAFLEYTAKFIVMSCAATYYWTSDAEEEGEAEVMYSVKIALINHVGSIAMGSFVIGFVGFFNTVFMYAARRIENAAPTNIGIKCCSVCASCIVLCFEQFVDHVNIDSYAYMANTGENFCSSAYNGMLINIKHSLTFQYATTCAKNILAICKWAIIFINIATFWFVAKYVTTGATEVHNLWNPSILVFLWTYVTATIFLGVFETSIISMMTCLCVDMDLHEGEPQSGPPCFHDSLEDIKVDSAAIEKEDARNIAKAEAKYAEYNKEKEVGESD